MNPDSGCPYPTQWDSMKATFIETTEFTRSMPGFLPDDAYAALQYLLMKNPDAGAVMPGCGGLRKIRTADARRGKGKRGGAAGDLSLCSPGQAVLHARYLRQGREG